MAAITFDTLKFANKLKTAGVPPAQAEAEAEALAEVFEANLNELATKADLREVEIRLTGEIGLLKWMLGVTVAGVATILIKLFI
ncbi:MAG: DUF1640 domain-containing protein [Burkholderia gladioli]